MRAAHTFVLAIAAAVGGLFAPGVAHAHGMIAEVKVNGASVRADVFFDDDVPAEFATISVTDASGAEVRAGTTDERGVWTFPAPPPGEYLLTAKCIGHTATVRFPVAGEPDAPAAVYVEPRRNKAVGLTAGVGGLLALSAAFWLIRRRRE